MTPLAASGRPLVPSAWDTELTKLTLAAEELSPPVRRAISSVLSAVLADGSLSALETISTAALLETLRDEPTRSTERERLRAQRIVGLAARARDRALAVA